MNANQICLYANTQTQHTKHKSTKQTEANANSPLCILFTNMMTDMCVKPLSVVSGHVLNSNCSNYVMN